MKSHGILQLVFIVALGTLALASVALAYVWWLLVLGRGGLADLLVWLNIANAVRGASAIAASLTILVGLHQLLGRPRPAAVRRPVHGLVVAVVGLAASGVTATIPFAGPVLGAAVEPSGAAVIVGLVAASAIGSVLFLAGLAMMVLWDPVLAWDGWAPPPPSWGPETMK